MSKTTAIAGVVVVALIVGGIVFSANKNTSSQAGNTTLSPTALANTTNTVQARKAGIPIVITNTSVASSDTTAVLTGSVNPNGATTSYWYEYSLSSSLSNKFSSQKQTAGSGFVAIATPGYITGLTQDTTYHIRLVAENQYGKIFGSQYSFKTTQGNPPPVGSVPTTKTLLVSGLGRTTVNLRGEVTPNQASTQAWFEYGQSPNLGSNTALESLGGGTIKLPVLVSLADLLPATTYYFRLNAQNKFGTVNGEILNFKTNGPAGAMAPSAVTKNVSGLGSSTATFHGTVGANGAATSHWFEYSTDSLLGSALLQSTEKKSMETGSGTIAVEADVSGLQAKTDYYVRLVAENNIGVVRGERITFKTK